MCSAQQSTIIYQPVLETCLYPYSADHQAVVAEGDTVLDAAFDEIQQFVQENSWFNEIEEFCNSWNVQTKLKWKDAQAYHIEVKTYITKPHTSYYEIGRAHV